MDTTEIQGTTFGGSSRNRVRVELSASSDKRTLRIRAGTCSARVSMRNFAQEMRTLSTGGCGMPATAGSESLAVVLKGNCAEITFVGAQTTALERSVKVGVSRLREALQVLGRSGEA